MEIAIETCDDGIKKEAECKTPLGHASAKAVAHEDEDLDES